MESQIQSLSSSQSNIAAKQQHIIESLSDQQEVTKIIDENTNQLFIMFSKFQAATNFARIRDKSEDWIFRIANQAITLNGQLEAIIEGIYASIAGTLSPKLIEPDSVTKPSPHSKRKLTQEVYNLLPQP